MIKVITDCCVLCWYSRETSNIQYRNPCQVKFWMHVEGKVYISPWDVNGQVRSRKHKFELDVVIYLFIYENLHLNLHQSHLDVCYMIFNNVYLTMSLKITLVRCLMITQNTRIFYTFMFWLDMFMKTTLVCKLIITLITRIPDTFMFRSIMW